MLPLTIPLLLLALFPAYWGHVGWEGLAWGLLCGTLGSVMVWALYPRDNIPTGRLKGERGGPRGQWDEDRGRLGAPFCVSCRRLRDNRHNTLRALATLSAQHLR
jgi:hypothetical protein